jgi:hypothetical protein
MSKSISVFVTCFLSVYVAGAIAVLAFSKFVYSWRVALVTALPIPLLAVAHAMSLLVARPQASDSGVVPAGPTSGKHDGEIARMDRRLAMTMVLVFVASLTIAGSLILTSTQWCARAHDFVAQYSRTLDGRQTVSIRGHVDRNVVVDLEVSGRAAYDTSVTSSTSGDFRAIIPVALVRPWFEVTASWEDPHLHTRERVVHAFEAADR